MKLFMLLLLIGLVSCGSGGSGHTESETIGANLSDTAVDNSGEPLKSGIRVQIQAIRAWDHDNTQQVIISHNGFDREFLVFTPEDLDNSLAPVVVLFHRAGSSAEEFWNTSGWIEKAEREGFVLLIPQALSLCFSNGLDPYPTEEISTGWNLGDVESSLCSGEVADDDVGFFYSMIQAYDESYLNSVKDVFVTGHELGGSMAATLAIEASDVVSGGVSMGGAPRVGVISADLPTTMAPFYFFMGTRDFKIIHEMGIFSLPADSEILGIPLVKTAKLDPFLVILGLSVQDGVQAKGESSWSISWPESQFTWEIFEGLGREYPNGYLTSFSGPDKTWEFFQSL